MLAGPGLHQGREGCTPGRKEEGLTRNSVAWSSPSIFLPALRSLSLSPSMSLSVTVLVSDRKEGKLHACWPVGMPSSAQLPDDSRIPRFPMSAGVRICPHLCLCISFLGSSVRPKCSNTYSTIYRLCDLREMTSCLCASINSGIGWDRMGSNGIGIVPIS